ncbi:DDE-type integrase/transposase/recombinase [Acuticoccus mangrovi]|uniref:Transposase family protein n=1 Tax=Acuticoccus mangrovi TaxID=2796142 RepID=A0A934MG73_9HYPH|nr:transposase family protein [Acuticoccus mangrovi]
MAAPSQRRWRHSARQSCQHAQKRLWASGLVGHGGAAAAGVPAQRRRDRRQAGPSPVGSGTAHWLAKAGLGRLKALDPKDPPRRYRRERPDELVHLDIKKLRRFERAGHRVTGRRRSCRNKGAGWDFVHVAIDDATRLAYVEVLADEKRGTATAFLARALRWFRTRGVKTERVMTDNGSAYVFRLFAKALRSLGIRHIRARPHSQKTSSTAELHPDPSSRVGLRHPLSLFTQSNARPAAVALVVQ